MTNITYSQANINDLKDFHPLFVSSIRELFPEYTLLTREYFVEQDYKLEWLESVIKKGDKILFLARNNDLFVGYLLVSKVYGGVSVASWLAVSAEYQKQGIATKLVSMWEEYSLTNFAHALQLWTTDKNLDFYEKRGFVNAGTFKDAWFGVDMPMMYKKMAEPEEKNYLHNFLANKSKFSANHMPSEALPAAEQVGK